MATIAFLGLGQMGSPMANNLLQKGHSLQVFDVNTQGNRRCASYAGGHCGTNPSGSGSKR
ncbi:hypothetical protein EIMP300_06630 [Escherichia coli]|uniref:6-phosphogluconate dehydrogenase NADP-binding domain-containing protein n=1 Tax=Escherichia coli TaxID=562 RepID=A0A8S0FH24_ECOLX|nr:hypothetical protein EIMP300_06630 [Escherichia coli]